MSMEIPRTKEQLLVDLRQIFQDGLHRDDADAIQPDTLFFADLGLASIDAVVLGEAIQSHFDQILPFGDLLAAMGSQENRDLRIGDLIDFMKTNLH